MKSLLFGRRPETLPGSAADLDRSTPYVRPRDSELFPVWERWNRALLAGVVATAIGWAGYSLLWPRLRPTPGQRLSNHRRLAPEASFATNPAVSVDGQTVAWVAGNAGSGLDLWIQGRDGKARQLTHEGFAASPDVSPDGRSVVFEWNRREAGIYLAGSGEPRRLSPSGESPRYSPDGKWIAYTDEGALWLIPSSGGDPRRLRSEFDRVASPVFHPDSTRILFEGQHGGIRDWWITTIGDAPAVATGAAHALGTELDSWTAPQAWHGDAVYLSGSKGSASSLWRIAMPVSSGPEPLTEGRPGLTHVRAGGGRLVYSETVVTTEIRSTGTVARLLDERANQLPSVSSDGGSIAYLSDRTGLVDLWVANLRVPGDPGVALSSFQPVGYRPVISPDGKRVAFSTIERDKCRILIVDVASRQVEQSFEGCLNLWDWSADGRYLITYQSPDAAQVEASWLDVKSLRRGLLLAEQGMKILGVRFSPDSQRVAFSAGTLNHLRVYVAPFRTGNPVRRDEWQQIRFEGHATTPAWAPDGTVLFRGRRHGVEAIWSVSGGEPQMVADLGRPGAGAIGLADLGFAMSVGGGRVFYNVARNSGAIWMAEMR